VSSSDALPPPPWSASRPRAPRAKPPLSAEAIVDVALTLLDAEGLEAVTMRRVAELLGTGPASLYQHVSGKDELLELLFDRVAGEIELPAAPADGDWQEPLKALLRSMRTVLSSHRDIAYVTLGRIPTGSNALGIAEGMLAIMDAGGVPSAVSTYAVDTLALFIGAVSYEDSIRASQFGGEEAEYFERVHEYFAALPADRFPTLARLSEQLTRPEEGPDDRFEFALDVQVRGIAALAAAASDG
jgi:AcrR family transcriptional regulator